MHEVAIIMKQSPIFLGNRAPKENSQVSVSQDKTTVDSPPRILYMIILPPTSEDD